MDGNTLRHRLGQVSGERSTLKVSDKRSGTEPDTRLSGPKSPSDMTGIQYGNWFQKLRNDTSQGTGPSQDHGTNLGPQPDAASTSNKGNVESRDQADYSQDAQLLNGIDYNSIWHLRHNSQSGFNRRKEELKNKYREIGKLCNEIMLGYKFKEINSVDMTRLTNTIKREITIDEANRSFFSLMELLEDNDMRDTKFIKDFRDAVYRKVENTSPQEQT